jgi:hypothetical protein
VSCINQDVDTSTRLVGFLARRAPHSAMSNTNATSGDTANNAYDLTDKHQIDVLMYLPVATGSLSLIGSSLILLSLYRGRSSPRQRSNSSFRSKAQTSIVYHRLVGVMSVYDIMYTLFSSMFAGLLNPQETFTRRDGYGTRFTCSLQGFFIQWGYGCFTYGAWLSVYYVLTIRYNVTEATLARYMEPAAHLSVFLFYFGTAVIASSLGLMNPSPHAQCWTLPYPLSCMYDDDVPCVRGVRYKQAILWMLMLPSCLSVLVILICLVMVVYTVWQQRNIVRAQQKRLAQQQESIVTAGPSMSLAFQPTPATHEPQSMGHPEQNQSTRPMATSSMDRLTNEVIGQCLFYGFTFVNSVLWINVAAGYAVASNGSKLDIYWVRTILAFLRCSRRVASSAHLVSEP